MTDWIKVTDRLPERDVKVLIFDPTWNEISVSERDRADRFFDDYEGISRQYPTHWQPLPEPPREEL